MDDTKINLDNVTFSDLRIHYRTGRAYLIRQEGRTKTYGYRKGMQTDLGDLEENTWVQLVSGLIQTSGEQQLQKGLLEWEQEHNYCHNSRKEMEIHVLELYTDRIFDNPLWVDYIPFNRKYRPEVLASAKLVWIQTECCKIPAQITQEQLEKNTSNTYGVPCPLCGRWSAFHICPPEEVSEGG